ncbi:11153_t:CDS:2, partial [Acaulospora morrowiae]
ENSMLRSSILQFKNDFQKQAKRIKASQEMLRSIPVMKQTSPESSTVSNVNILQKRIKELEEELRLMKTDNEKQKALVTKYRERWEKLKESAKKRRVNKQGDPATQQTAEPLSSPKTTPTPDSAQLPQSPQSLPSSPSHSKLPQTASTPSSTTITATTITTAITAPESRKHQSLPEINLPFALQKPSHKPGFGEILDGSTSSKSNIGTPQKNPISPTTTIVRTIETDANNVYDENSSNRSASVNNSDENSNDGINGSIETTSPLRFLSRRESGGSALPTVTTVTIEGITSLSNQKELDPDE